MKLKKTIALISAILIMASCKKSEEVIEKCETKTVYYRESTRGEDMIRFIYDHSYGYTSKFNDTLLLGDKINLYNNSLADGEFFAAMDNQDYKNSIPYFYWGGKMYVVDSIADLTIYLETGDYIRR